MPRALARAATNAFLIVLSRLDVCQHHAGGKATQGAFDASAIFFARLQPLDARTAGEVGDACEFEIGQYRASVQANPRHAVTYLAYVHPRHDVERLDLAMRPRQLPDDAAQEGGTHARSTHLGVLEQGEILVARKKARHERHSHDENIALDRSAHQVSGPSSVECFSCTSATPTACRRSA